LPSNTLESTGIHLFSTPDLIANSTWLVPTVKFLVQNWSSGRPDFSKMVSNCISPNSPLPLLPVLPKKVFSIFSKGLSLLNISCHLFSISNFCLAIASFKFSISDVFFTNKLSFLSPSSFAVFNSALSLIQFCLSTRKSSRCFSKS